jgi:hypothetical protein
MMTVPVKRTRIAAALFASAALALLAAPSGAAPAQGALFERYRAECIAQYAYLRGPGRVEIVRSHVRDCIMAKMQARALEPPSGEPALHLDEAAPSLVKNSGPASAKGVVYFVRGYYPGEPTPDRFNIVPYFLKSLNASGWDAIDARGPAREPDPGPARGLWMARRAEPFVGERLAALKAQGYRRVVLAGHSWGGWLGLLLGKNSVADALIASVPSAFGKPTSAYTGKTNPNFRLALTQFSPAIAGVGVPTVLILPEDHEWDPDPAVRAAIADKNFARTGVPHLVIDRPRGFTGHTAGRLPFFDFAFGKCVAAFLERPETQPCRLPPIANDDFRSILDIKQVADADKKQIASAEELVGKHFGVYALGAVFRRYDYLSMTQRRTTLPTREFREDFSFRDGLLCAGTACSVVVKWSEGGIFEFDPKTGKLKAWWVPDLAS